MLEWEKRTTVSDLRSEVVPQADVRDAVTSYNSRVLCAKELVRMVKCLPDDGLWMKVRLQRLPNFPRGRNVYAAEAAKMAALIATTGTIAC